MPTPLTLTRCIPPFITVIRLRIRIAHLGIQSIMAELLEGLVIAHLGQGIAVEHDNKIIYARHCGDWKPSRW